MKPRCTCPVAWFGICPPPCRVHNPPQKSANGLRDRIKLLTTVALIGAIVSIIACGKGAEAPVLQAAPTQPQCTAGNGGVQICIDGNGNVVTINPAGTPTPTPTPSSPNCSKGIPIYQEIVVQAEVGIPATQSQASYMAALVAKLKTAGFLSTMGGLLPSDEIAIKTSATAPFSETYDVWRADNTPHVLYQETCTPARF